MATLYTLYDNNVPLATNMSLDVCRAMWDLHPERISYTPTTKPDFRYDVCFSTPPMNRDSAHDLIQRSVDPVLFPGYTVYDGQGSWEGQREDSYTLTVVQEENDEDIKALAEIIKQ